MGLSTVQRVSIVIGCPVQQQVAADEAAAAAAAKVRFTQISHTDTK